MKKRERQSMIDETQAAGAPASGTAPKPEDRAIKSGEVKVRVVAHSLFEAGQRYTKGQQFVTTAKRAAGLKGFVEPCQ
jgi:hypothetical protein